jgi:hypothetical protein
MMNSVFLTLAWIVLGYGILWTVVGAIVIWIRGHWPKRRHITPPGMLCPHGLNKLTRSGCEGCAKDFAASAGPDPWVYQERPYMTVPTKSEDKTYDFLGAPRDLFSEKLIREFMDYIDKASERVMVEMIVSGKAPDPPQLFAIGQWVRVMGNPTLHNYGLMKIESYEPDGLDPDCLYTVQCSHEHRSRCNWGAKYLVPATPWHGEWWMWADKKVPFVFNYSFEEDFEGVRRHHFQKCVEEGRLVPVNFGKGL